MVGTERGDMNRILDSQLATLKTDHIDYYLLHSLARESWEKLKGLGVLDFVDEAKKTGKIRNAGFSFHGDLSTFRDIVDAYDWEFCQIQYQLSRRTDPGRDGRFEVCRRKTACGHDHGTAPGREPCSAGS